jgi:putative transposase
MPRVARIVIPDCPHHVTQRGNNRQDVFFADQDYAVYLEILYRQARTYGLAVDGYCLMTNHVHLIVTPAGEPALAEAIGRTHFVYSQYVNRLHRRSGHLWQNRFYSCALDDEHYWTATAYVEQNPLRARLAHKAWRYPHSSACAHVTGQDASGLLDLAAWRGRQPPDWAAVLDERQDESTLRRVRGHTCRGRPLGSDHWLARLEARLGRRLRPLPVGRPRGWRKHKATADPPPK